MTAAPILEVRSIGKSFITYRSELLRLARWLGARPAPAKEYWAVRDVSFSVGAGQAVGIIGQNGAGKTTLLRLIRGTLHPTTGSVFLGGRASAILELGLGFSADFTGRENVRLAGGLMGLAPAELEALIPEIESFAEIGDFFEQPLRVYSSGMQARLAFSLATAVRPDVLIVDEALSVGDSYFQHKSFDRIRAFKEAGTALLFVSHDMAAVRALCDRAILLDRGAVVRDGLPEEVVDYYNALIAEREVGRPGIEQRRQDGRVMTRSGTGQAVIESIRLLDATTRDDLAMVRVDQGVGIEVVAHVKDDLPRLVLGLMLRDRLGHVVWGTNTWHTRQVLDRPRAGARYLFEFSLAMRLGPGSYSVSAALASTDTHLVDNYEWIDNLLVFEVFNSEHPVFIGTTWLDPLISIKPL